MPAAVVSIQSRECRRDLLERLPGSMLFPERPLGAAILAEAVRGGNRLLYVCAGLADVEVQVDYFLGLLPGGRDARDRVEVLSLDDSTPRWLSEKVLDEDSPEAAGVRARIWEFVERARAADEDARLSFFEPSRHLQGLAASLGVPGDQADADVIPLGTKAASRALFAEAGVPVVAGTPEVRTVGELAEGVAALVRAGHRRLVVKLSDSEYGAGMGNALVEVGDRTPEQAAAELPSASLVDSKRTWAGYAAEIPVAGALVEQWVGGDEVRSPSFQGRVEADGSVRAVSTHEQVLSGGQTFVGCSFPADAAYRDAVVAHGTAVGRRLAAKGFRGGDFAADFIAVRTGSAWALYGCELNLRSTGTKHGFTTATALLDTLPGPDGTLVTEDGPRVYTASDTLTGPSLVGRTPASMLEDFLASDLPYDHIAKTGVVLHMLSALHDYGKFGAVCIGRTAEEAAEQLRSLRALVGLPLD